MSQIGMPFHGGSGTLGSWPNIVKLTTPIECRDKKAHRLYKAIGIECPCGPCCMNITDKGGKREVKFYGNDIVFTEKDQEVFKLSDLFVKLQQLEQEVKELKEKSAIS